MHAFLLALLLTTPSTDLLAPYRGQPVLSVQIDAPAEENPEELKSLINIEPGYLLRQEDLKTSLKRLYALGRFSNILVYGKRIKGTVQLTFKVEPIRRVIQLDITGLKSIDYEQLRKALPIVESDEVDSKTQHFIKRALKTHLAEIGYPAARIKITESPTKNVEQVHFQIHITENNPTRVHSISFEGNPRLSVGALQSIMKTKAGDILNKPYLEKERDELMSLYLSRGFRKANIEPLQYIPTPQGTRVVMTIDAGERIGIEFTGNQLLSAKALLQLWPDAHGRLREGDLMTFQKRIENHYHRASYPDAQVTTRGFRDDKNQTIRYLVQIQEGLPAQVRKITFSGNRVIPSEILREHIYSRLKQTLAPTGLLAPLHPIDHEVSRFGNSAPPDYYGSSTPNTVPRIPNQFRWVESTYDQALDDLNSVYKDRGFLNVQIGPIKKTVSNHLINIEIPVIEGLQSFLNSVTFRGNTGIQASHLLQEMIDIAEIEPGDPLSNSRIETARIAILRQYRNRGYIYAKVFSKIEFSANKTSGDLIFLIEEGPQVQLERILIRGNEFTSEALIRSRLHLEPGKPYQLDKALESHRSIAGLGVFSSVNLRLIDEEIPSERKDLIAEVREQGRHRIETIGGVSTEDGPRVGLSYSHINLFGIASTFTTAIKLNRQTFFELYGPQGESLKERYKTYKSTEDQITKALERELRLGIRSPQFVSLPLSPLLRIDFTNLRDNKMSYSLDSTTATFGVELFAGDHLKLAIDPQANITMFDCTNDTCQEDFAKDRQPINKEIRNHEGLKLASTLTYDWRDNRFNPRSGYILSLNAEYAQGSDFEDTDALLNSGQSEPSYAFTKLEARATGYIPISKAVLALALWGGGISMARGQLTDTPLDERFFVGGRSSLRGFQEESLIPEDVCYERGTQPASCRSTIPAVTTEDSSGRRRISAFPSKGGNFYVLAKAELRLPITKIMSLNLFLDAGNLWMFQPTPENATLRYGTGAGLSFATPVGPISFSIGINPAWKARNLESPIKFYFSIGQF